MQLSSDAAVKRVLAGEKADAKVKPPPSKPRDKESREPKAEEQKSHRNKEVAFVGFFGGVGGGYRGTMIYLFGGFISIFVFVESLCD